MTFENEFEDQAFDSDEGSLERGLTREEILRRALAGGIVLGAGGFAPAALGRAEAKPKRGGRLRVGIVGGSAKDKIDAHTPTTHTDQSRVRQLYEPLAHYNEQFKLELQLAEEITSKRPDVWDIRLKSGIEFHNGKTVTADDVIFSLRRIVDPKIASFGGAGLSALDPKRMRKLDKRTVRLTLKRPDVTVRDELGNYFNGIVPVGYDPKKPVGTGAFTFGSFTPGQQSRFTRFPNYWRTGQPYVDEVVIIDFPEDTARVNALLGGQVDAIDQVPYGQVPIITGRKNLRILESPAAQWLPFTMRVDQAPFNDVRVRQAFRLIVDRPQMIKQALAGHGRVANDLYSPYDPCFASNLPQRHQDIDRAKSLLKAAGKSDLTVELQTASVAAGLVEAAQVFAQQAKKAGVTVKVNKLDGGVFYGDNYLKWAFAQDFWGTRNYFQQAAAGSLPASPYNETHWAQPTYLKLVARAKRTLDQKKRCALLKQAQTIEYTSGGHIIWAFVNLVDGYSSKLQGLKPDRGTLPLNQYGFRHVWFS